jgi:hypothetical protein
MLNVELLDARGAPVAGEPFRALLPDGAESAGETDESGRAVVVTGAEGTCGLAFPERAPGDVRPPEGVGGERAWQVPTGRKQTFRLAGLLTEFVLDAAHDVPVVGARFSAALPDGRRVEGTVGARKRVRVVGPEGGAGAKVQLELHLGGDEPADAPEDPQHLYDGDDEDYGPACLDHHVHGGGA